MDESPWFLTNGEWRMGPLTLDEAAEVLGREHRTGEILAWREGLDGWMPAERVAELAAAPRPVAWPSAPASGPAVPAGPETAWFLVGGWKLVVMCVATFGLYEIYWFFQQWQHVRRRSGERLQPVLRTFFAGIFCYSLFRRVAESAAARNLPAPSPVWTTVAFIAMAVTWQLPEPWRLVSLLQLGPLVMVQRAASAAALAETPAADPNTRLTPINWFGVGLFSVIILLAVLGALLPKPAPPAAAPKPTAVAAARSGEGDLQPGDRRRREAMHQDAVLHRCRPSRP